MNKKSKSILAVVASAVIATCAIAYWAWHAHFSPEAIAIAAVKSRLYDPDSAIFKDVAYVSRTGATCGSVNAKNLMGGYTGMRPFIARKDGTIEFAPTADINAVSLKEKIRRLSALIDFLKRGAQVCSPKAPAPTKDRAATHPA